jgi:hypothetical protein
MMPPLAVKSEPTGALTGVHLPLSHPTINVIVFAAGTESGYGFGGSLNANAGQARISSQ